MASPPTDRSTILSDVIACLEASKSAYCVLNGYEGYPQVIPSDVDLLVDDPLGVARRIVDRNIAQIVQAVQYESTAFSFVLSRPGADPSGFLLLDASSDVRDRGRIFFRAADILEGARRKDGFPIPAPDIEFTCYLIKKLMKGDLNESRAARLSALYREAPAESARRVRDLFAPADAELILRAARREAWDGVRAGSEGLRRALLRRTLFRRPRAVAAYWMAELARLARRVRNPVGLVVAFIGPDGVGKSTAARLVERRLGPLFRTVKRYHLRPHFGGGSAEGPPVERPHAFPERRLIASVVKLTLWWADSLFSYLVHILPRVVRAGLVTFDRHVLDLTVDPARYRYGAPLSLARLVTRLIPTAGTLFFYLDAPADIVRARKVELEEAEIERQRDAYRRLAATLPHGYVIDASAPAQTVADEIAETVLAVLSRRTASRLRLSSTNSAWTGSVSVSPGSGS